MGSSSAESSSSDSLKTLLPSSLLGHGFFSHPHLLQFWKLAKLFGKWHQNASAGAAEYSSPPITGTKPTSLSARSPSAGVYAGQKPSASAVGAPPTSIALQDG
jgi:hypothetical protein